MIAAVLNQLPTTSLEFAELPDPMAGAGEVVVRVTACGICGTDLHVMAGKSYRPSVPFVLGHEFVGVVSSAGVGAEHWVGRRVVPALFIGCGSCPQCNAGDERLCEFDAQVIGVLGHPGGFASYVRMEASHLIEVPAEVVDTVAASLVDAGATAHNAVRVALEASAYGEARHLVLGGGPLGLLAAELLLNAGDPVVVVELNPQRRAMLAERSVPHAASLGDVAGRFTTVVDCAGSPEPVAGALQLLRPRGRYLVVGYSVVPELDLSAVSRRELELRGIRSGRRSDLERVLGLVARGELLPPTITTWPLVQVNDALSALRQGAVAGKAVVVSSLSTQPGGALD